MSSEREPLDVIAGGLSPGHGPFRHLEELPPREATWSAWPPWVAPPLLAALLGSGVERPWAHQRTAMDLAHDGEHVVLSTGTSSGKSLGYLVPLLDAALDGLDAPGGRGATALYLAPTKALGADQLARIEALGVPGVRAAAYDGDTSREEREWVRRHAQVVLTNPDLLHHSFLPGHRRWAPFLRSLRFVVVDECHTYRGVFGAHVAGVLRRLRRVAARYGTTPTFVLASATVSDPAAHASRLVGMPVSAVTEDGSPRGAVRVALWEPETSGGRRPATTTVAGRMLADLVDADVQAVAFARGRGGAEHVATVARRDLEERRPGLGRRVAAYRGGYLPEERREIERRVRGRDLVGLAATNALELGVDLAGLDAVVVAGWPGRRASLWQQVGRAGRGGRDAAAVLVAGADPLDTHLVRHPDAIFGQPVEATVTDPDNPHVLTPHLAAAAAELPLTERDLELFGPASRTALARLTAAGDVRRRPTGWYWTGEGRPTEGTSLRGARGVVSLIERATGTIIGTVDEASAHTQAHPGAVHVHQGFTYVVIDLDLDGGCATVVRGDPGWTTWAQGVSTARILEISEESRLGSLSLSLGSVRIATQVVSFERRGVDGEVLGVHPLELPEVAVTTTAVWWTVPPGSPGATTAGLHGAEHASLALLPLVAACDRGDVGAVSSEAHPDTGLPTVLVHDTAPGGSGFAERGHAAAADWLDAAAGAVAGCGCASGCPACIQSPTCGSGNEPLDRQATAAHLALVAAALGDRPAGLRPGSVLLRR